MDIEIPGLLLSCVVSLASSPKPSNPNKSNPNKASPNEADPNEADPNRDEANPVSAAQVYTFHGLNRGREGTLPWHDRYKGEQRLWIGCALVQHVHWGVVAIGSPPSTGGARDGHEDGGWTRG